MVGRLNKKALLLVAAAALLVVLIGGFGASRLLAFELSRGLQDATAPLAEVHQNENDSDAFYGEKGPRVLFDPTPEYLMQIWAPEERRGLMPDAFDGLIFRIKTKLGALQSCGSVLQTMDTHFEADIGLFHRSNRTDVSAKFETLCHFENGAVVTTMLLKKEGGGWGLTGVQLADEMFPSGEAPETTKVLAP